MPREEFQIRAVTAIALSAAMFAAYLAEGWNGVLSMSVGVVFGIFIAVVRMEAMKEKQQSRSDTAKRDD